MESTFGGKTPGSAVRPWASLSSGGGGGFATTRGRAGLRGGAADRGSAETASPDSPGDFGVPPFRLPFSQQAPLSLTFPLIARPRRDLRIIGPFLLDRARAESHSEEAREDRKRRQWFQERNFGEAALMHGLKRANWRGLWRQQIQNLMIAAIQNLKILAWRRAWAQMRLLEFGPT